MAQISASEDSDADHDLADGVAAEHVGHRVGGLGERGALWSGVARQRADAAQAAEAVAIGIVLADLEEVRLGVVQVLRFGIASEGECSDKREPADSEQPDRKKRRKRCLWHNAYSLPECWRRD